jgi:metallo-beta-lactamase class B
MTKTHYLLKSASSILVALCFGVSLVQAQAVAAPVAKLEVDSLDGCPSKTIMSRFFEFGKTGKMPADLGRWLNDPVAQKIEPYQAFDNVHFVGVCWVSAWLIKTSDGYALIDTLHEPFVDQLIDNIGKLGVDLADIKYVLMTHGHFDHAGGAYKLKPLVPNAKFVMTQKGWDEAYESSSGHRPWKFLDTVNIVSKDGQSFTLGDATFTVYETPGHSFGTASYAFDVKDGDTIHHAFTVGGLGLNAIKSSAQVEAYINSVKRIQALAIEKSAPITVHLTTHPFSTGLTEASRKIPSRKPGEPHPLVDPKGFQKQLAELQAGGEQRLLLEQTKEASK